jgi:hypothetical protein
MSINHQVKQLMMIVILAIIILISLFGCSCYKMNIGTVVINRVESEVEFISNTGDCSLWFIANNPLTFRQSSNSIWLWLRKDQFYFTFIIGGLNNQTTILLSSSFSCHNYSNQEAILYFGSEKLWTLFWKKTSI